MYLKNLIFLAVLSLAYTLHPSGRVKRAARVVGGRDAKDGAIKYIVAIRGGTYFCGGGIIGERFILTAAHCLRPNETTKTITPLKVVAGVTSARFYNPADAIEIDVDKAYLPSVYQKSNGGRNDIAVLKLKKPLEIMKNSDKVQQLKLPEPLTTNPLKYPTYENVSVIFSGYGANSSEVVMENGKSKVVPMGAGYLHVANSVIDTNARCKKYWDTTLEKELCLSVVEDKTKKRPQGTCKGDSGSPAVYNNIIVIGVDSKSIYCDNNKTPTLFARVSYYIPFIRQAMSGNSTGLVVYTTK